MKKNPRNLKKNQNNGFIYVATCKPSYLNAAIFSAESLREYYPEANITLFTEERLKDGSPLDIFNEVYYDAPNNPRAKLWALSRTPYDLTVYLDSDIEIMSDEITTIFDQMPKSADILLTKIRGYNSKIHLFPGGELTDHCGMFMYRNDLKVLTFMDEWWNLWQKQSSEEWKWDLKLYPEELRQWDQWSYWWLQNKTTYAIRREYFNDDARWNFINGYKYSETDKDIILYHHTIK